MDIPNTSRDVPWFKPDITELDPAFRRIMEEYSKIPPDEVKSHILAVREKAWHTFPYPCIGQLNFLTLSIAGHSCYPRVVSTLKAPSQKATLLDLGCCFAQDIRQLVCDGVPSERLYGCDLEFSFLHLGYELFADKETLKTQFFAANIFDESGKLSEMEAQFDFIHAGSFLHLFNLDDQVRACTQMVRLMKPLEGSTAFGRQMGNVKGTAVPNKLDGKTLWQHDEASFKDMWREVGEATGTRWKVDVQLDEGEGMSQDHWTSEGCRRLKFEVVRLS